MDEPDIRSLSPLPTPRRSHGWRYALNRRRRRVSCLSLATLLLVLLCATLASAHAIPAAQAAPAAQPRASSATVDAQPASEPRAPLLAQRPALREAVQQLLLLTQPLNPSLPRDDASLARQLEALLSTPSEQPASLVRRQEASPTACAATSEPHHSSPKLQALAGILIPVLVILSGIFAGLTLGYMSLDETQLQVLATTGTPQQRKQAEKILPIRRDGHLLLTTLLVANMITNETLPIIIDEVIPGFAAVIISIVLVIIFAELIPQSVCSRYGLQVGARMATPTRLIIFVLYPIAWPISRILHYSLGPHHGTIYRRAELKELVNMHLARAHGGAHGGDLKRDVVTLVGGALDLQEKVAQEAMTPISNVLMLPITARLDYATLERIVRSGHSRIPIYAEIDVPAGRGAAGAPSGTVTPGRKGLFSALARKASFGLHNGAPGSTENSRPSSPAPEESADGQSGSIPTVRRKKIMGMLLVKQTVLLDPEDATPISDLVLNALPTVAADEPLLNILNAFQEGRSHMAIVSSKRRQRDADADGDEEDDRESSTDATAVDAHDHHLWRRARKHLGAIDEEKQLGGDAASSGSGSRSATAASVDRAGEDELAEEKAASKRSWMRRLVHGSEPAKQRRRAASRSSATEEQVALEAEVDMPIGIITLEDLLEELLAEEIYDEHDKEGAGSGLRDFSPPASPSRQLAAANEAGNSADGDEKGALPANEAATSEAHTPPLRSLTFPSEANTAPNRLRAALALSAPRRIPQRRRRTGLSDTERDSASDGDDEDTADDSDAMAQSSELPPRAQAAETAKRASSAEPGPRTGAAPAAPRQRRSQRGRSLLRRATAGAASTAGENSPASGVARSSTAANLTTPSAAPTSSTSTPVPTAARGARFKSTPVVVPKAEAKTGAGAAVDAPTGAAAQQPPPSDA